MKILILVLGASLFTGFAQAQVNGTVTDIHSSPLAYATIVLKNEQDTTKVKSTLSNDQGAFAFKAPPGTYRITVSMVGFETYTKSSVIVDSGTVNLGNLLLLTSSTQLSAITVKGTTPFVKRQIDRTVVNVEQNLNNAGKTVLEVMQKLPGVQMSDDGGLTLNGKSGINVLIDGKTTYLSAQDLATLLGGMPASGIQKIEIMTNPSSKYDASGNAGIINIVKKKNHKEGFNGTLNGNIAQGYYSRYGGGINLSYKTESYNLYAADSYTYNKQFSNRLVTTDALNGNALLTEEASDNNNTSTARNESPSLGLDLYLSKKTTLSFLENANIGITSVQTLSTMNILDADRTLTNTENFSAINKDRPFNYTTDIGLVQSLDTLGRQFTIDLDYSRFKYRPGQYTYTTLNDDAGNFLSQSNVFLDQSRQLNIYAVKTDYTQPFSSKGTLEAGFKSSYVKSNNDATYYNQSGGQNIVDSTQSDYSINSENINAAYISINKPFKKVTLQAGLRAEQTVTKGQELLTRQNVDLNFLSLFPTTFIDYKLTDEQGVTIRLGRRIERSDYHELIPFRRPLTPTLYFEGNPNLKPQLTWHGELTYSWHSELFITFGYDIDHNYVQTLPYLDSNKVTVTRVPTNIQHSGSWNVNLNYSKKIGKWWSTDNTFSLYQNYFSGWVAGFSLNNPGILTVYFTSNNSFPLTGKLSVEADFEYDSKRQLISSSFGAYSSTNIGVRQQLFGNRGSISLNANNIFNSENHNAIDRYQNLYQYSYFNLYNRSIRLNFTYRFGSGKLARSKNNSGSKEEQQRAGD